MKGKLRLLDHFNNMKIGRKIMSAFVMASIVPILTIQFIGYNMNSNSLKRKIDTLMVDNLTQLSERVDLTMDIYSNLVYQIYVDDKIIENVNTLLNGEWGGQGGGLPCHLQPAAAGGEIRQGHPEHQCDLCQWSVCYL